MAKESKYTANKRVNLTPELEKAVDDFRFERRLKSETEALRILIETGLARAAELKTPAELFAEAKRLLRQAIEIHQVNAALRFGALTGADDPEDALRIADELFTSEGHLKQ